MLRDKSLIPLSHQHQHALALCVRIDRAQPIPEQNLPLWRDEIDRDFTAELQNHFAAEEAVLFSAARQFSELTALIDMLVTEHASLREYLSQAGAGTMSAQALSAFAAKLSAHIRKEERQLFQRMQQLMRSVQLADLGRQLASALTVAQPSCAVPNEATKLRRSSS